MLTDRPSFSFHYCRYEIDLNITAGSFDMSVIDYMGETYSSTQRSGGSIALTVNGYINAASLMGITTDEEVGVEYSLREVDDDDEPPRSFHSRQPTEAPEEPTEAPEPPPTEPSEQPTEAPEPPPTEPPEKPTQAPEPPPTEESPQPPNDAPEEPTEAPEVPEQPPTQPTSGPDSPYPPEYTGGTSARLSLSLASATWGVGLWCAALTLFL